MDLTPTIGSEGQEDQSWLGSAHGTSSGRSVTLDASKFVAATHYPNGYLPSGTAIGVITATQKYGPYDTTTPATDGRQVFVGYTLTATVMKTSTSTPQAVLFEHGRVIVANLPFATGIGSIDSAGKTASAGRIIHV